MVNEYSNNSNKSTKSNKSNSLNSPIASKSNFMGDQNVMRKLSSIFLENQNNIRNNLRKVNNNNKTKSDHNTIRYDYDVTCITPLFVYFFICMFNLTQISICKISITCRLSQFR